MRRLLAAGAALWLACAPARADQVLGAAYQASTGVPYFRDSPSNILLAIASGCSTNQFLAGFSTNTGQAICAQPSFGNLSGQITPSSQIPANGVTPAQMSQAAAGTLRGNVTGATANVSDAALTAYMDAALGSAVGTVAVRGTTSWSGIAPGTSGSALTSNGSGVLPSYQTGAASTPNALSFTQMKIAPGGTPASQATVTATRMILPGPSNGLALSSVSVTCATGTSGANGLDTGTVAASAWYAIYVISNGTTTACLLSTSATSPSLPSGYTYSARVGWQRTNGSSQLQGIVQYGRSAQWIVGSNLAALPSITSGAVGSISTPTYVAENVVTLGAAPTTAAGLKVMANVNNGSAGIVFVAPNASYGLPTTGPFPPLSLGSSGNFTIADVSATILLETSNIYVASGSGGSVSSLGWEDNL